jgi:hypothetical protein|tara:strand:- start:410 stop:904 length:495 start_codon:yes stop_codon:yes gene_type:complete
MSSNNPNNNLLSFEELQKKSRTASNKAYKNYIIDTLDIGNQFVKTDTTLELAKSLKIALDQPASKVKLSQIREKIQYKNLSNGNVSASSAVTQEVSSLLYPLVDDTINQLAIIYNDPENVENVNNNIWDPFFVMLWPYYDGYLYMAIAYYIITLILVFVVTKYF